MNTITLNREIAQNIFNDGALREELALLLQALIDEELAKPDEEANFDLIDEYCDMLNELYEDGGALHVVGRLQTSDEFLKYIGDSRKQRLLATAAKTAVVACAALAVIFTANTVTEKATGIDVLANVARAVRNILTGDTEALGFDGAADKTATEKDVKTDKSEASEKEEDYTTQHVYKDGGEKPVDVPGNGLFETTTSAVTRQAGADLTETTERTYFDEKAPENSAQTQSAKSPAVTQSIPPRTHPGSETQTAAPSKAPQTTLSPKNPNLEQVLTPENPPASKPAETTTKKTFIREDEDETAAPQIIRLTPTYDSDFKRDYKVGEAADFSGLTITASYDNGSQKQIPVSSCDVRGFSTESPANRIVTVTYEGCSFSFLIRVEEA